VGIEIDFFAAGMRFLWLALVLSVWSGVDYHWKVLRRLDLR
jgi:phosphatidylglycerophosphate synthase